jgi:hypothetical protein
MFDIKARRSIASPFSGRLSDAEIPNSFDKGWVLIGCLNSRIIAAAHSRKDLG